LHIFDAGKTLFENAIDKLSDKGIYVIEDIGSEDIMKYQDYFSDQPNFNADFIIMNTYERENNNMIVIRKNIKY
jgi:hypothetical protein